MQALATLSDHEQEEPADNPSSADMDMDSGHPEEYQDTYDDEDPDGLDASTSHILTWSPPRHGLFGRFSPPTPPKFDLDYDGSDDDAAHGCDMDSSLSMENVNPMSGVLTEFDNVSSKGDDPSQIEASQADEDDPFGFTTITRQLQQSRRTLPRLVAINERHLLLRGQSNVATKAESIASSHSSHHQ
ncbi:hypothetical protein BGZ94_006090, partial [Podila epigama]